MVRETALTPSDLIWPLFIIDGHNERTRDQDHAGRRAAFASTSPSPRRARRRRPAFRRWRCFPTPRTSLRNEDASEAYNPDNLMCRALSAIKAAVPEIGLIADVALDEYSSDGQDGLVRDGESSTTKPSR